MPDLDHFLDTVLADVAAGTRPPGAPAAIKRARRRRSAAAASAAVAAVALVAVGGSLAGGRLGDARPAPIGPPATPAPESPSTDGSTTPPPGSEKSFVRELRGILAQEPGWPIAAGDPTILQPCGGDWSSAAEGESGGTIPVRTSAGEVGSAWADAIGFPSAVQASDAVAVLVANLESCSGVDWQAQPGTRAGVVVVSSAVGVVWIHLEGDGVSTLQVPSAGGLPPAGVQDDVADWIAAYGAWRGEQRPD
ncbi:hypothetical protein E8D34_04860 [Nocardioides sp. GY 10113]|uniref:hypothetical protein n=1 Tax=Nocardioides sp. GY 10113 TaxID=2569761 RepID=UPI0010A80EB4|nr:hypothetical protein [Nocardioides sp. GY 10113]TIC88274.1 hypothetical protein E8D34_04860 [Nocardioides sp. GY 10113]